MYNAPFVALSCLTTNLKVLIVEDGVRIARALTEDLENHMVC